MKKFFNLRRGGQKGFTLIELLVVIAIIGVLASIVIASLNTARRKSRDTRRVADQNQAKLSLELYFDTARSYPVATSTTGYVPTFIARYPHDPIFVGATDYIYASFETDGGAACTAGTACLYFHIGASIEDLTVAALQADADRCGTGSVTGCTQLLNSTIDGRDNGFDCPAGSAAIAGHACYDLTP